ncbi:unnamed protein product, partial [Pleuronectes platessa]
MGQVQWWELGPGTMWILPICMVKGSRSCMNETVVRVRELARRGDEGNRTTPAQQDQHRTCGRACAGAERRECCSKPNITVGYAFSVKRWEARCSAAQDSAAKPGAKFSGPLLQNDGGAVDFRFQVQESSREVVFDIRVTASSA